MISVPLKVISIPLDLFLSKVLTENASSKILVAFLLLLIEVARVVTTCFLTMSAPFGQAQPAEIMTTLPAGHVVATLILLDIGSTLGTRLGVGLDPHQILGVHLLLLVPHHDLVARSRHVRFLLTLSAVRVTTLALNPFL